MSRFTFMALKAQNGLSFQKEGSDYNKKHIKICEILRSTGMHAMYIDTYLQDPYLVNDPYVIPAFYGPTEDIRFHRILRMRHAAKLRTLTFDNSVFNDTEKLRMSIASTPFPQENLYQPDADKVYQSLQDVLPMKDIPGIYEIVNNKEGVCIPAVSATPAVHQLHETNTSIFMERATSFVDRCFCKLYQADVIPETFIEPVDRDKLGKLAENLRGEGDKKITFLLAQNTALIFLALKHGVPVYCDALCLPMVPNVKLGTSYARSVTTNHQRDVLFQFAEDSEIALEDLADSKVLEKHFEWHMLNTQRPDLMQA